MSNYLPKINAPTKPTDFGFLALNNGEFYGLHSESWAWMGSSDNRMTPDTLRLKHQVLGLPHYARPTSASASVLVQQTPVTWESTHNNPI